MLAVLVLVGYALVLAGSSAGHGWRLVVHLLSTEHGGAHAAAPNAVTTGIVASVEAEPPGITDRSKSEKTPEHEHSHPGSPHRHAAQPDEPAHQHAVALSAALDAEASEPQPDARATPDAPHAHGGRTHTHESADPGPDIPALLTLSLDKHCLFAGRALPPPPVRDGDAAPSAATLFSTVPPVEVPPPRRLG